MLVSSSFSRKLPDAREAGERGSISIELSGMERERMLRWIVAWCGLSAAWILLDGAGVDHEAAQALDVARIAARQLEELDLA